MTRPVCFGCKEAFERDQLMRTRFGTLGCHACLERYGESREGRALRGAPVWPMGRYSPYLGLGAAGAGFVFSLKISVMGLAFDFVQVPMGIATIVYASVLFGANVLRSPRTAALAVLLGSAGLFHVVHGVVP